ncbi:MAG: hypothetical protein IT488_00980 [Gammaproteobacteria bacterium]|nr:hypothetical protein [Gammaproteobacteria bacterium]
MNKDPELPLNKTVPAVYQAYAASEDEISLVDLWLVLLRHRRLIAVIVAIALLFGGAAAVLKNDAYSYTTTIQIARVGDQLLEQPDTLLAKLNESYIPYVLQQRRQQEPNAAQIQVSAEIPKNSTLIMLRSEGAESDADAHFKVHSQILDYLSRDHAPEIDVVKLNMENDLNRLGNQVDKLKDQATLLLAQDKRMNEQEFLLKDELKDLKRLIDSSESNRNKAIREVQGEAKAMTLMLIDTETRKYMEREGDIKERLLIGLPEERDRLKNDLADNLRGQAELQERLRESQAKIVNIRYTRPITPTLRSDNAHGVGGGVIVALAGILGLMMGVFAAFIAEFRSKVRERLDEQPRG